MTDCSHREWGVRLPSGQVQPAVSRPEAELLARYEASRQQAAGECVVMVREVVVSSWQPAESPEPASH